MKNLLLCLVFAFVMPLVASAQNYIYSADQSSEDPCCIVITAGVNDRNYDGTLIVEIDGVPTYTDLDAENINNIEHCFEGNGIHYVRFYVGDVLYDEYTFDITDCEGDCSVCNLTKIELELHQINGCNYFIDYRLLNFDGVLGYSPVCINPTVYWDFGDGTTSDDTPLTNGYFHDFPADGTYTVCLTFTVTNPQGIECSMTRCADVVVTGCDDPCCGLSLDGISVFTHPFFPCRAFIVPMASSYSTACGPVTYSWTIDGNPVQNNNSSNLFPTFNGSGAFLVCLTMSQGACIVNQCTTVVISDCPGFSDGGVNSRSSDWEILSGLEMSVAPNPARDWINVSVGENPFSNSEVITILDISGKVIQSTNAQANTITSIDVSRLPQGVYFVQVSNELGMISTERFVKTK